MNECTAALASLTYAMKAKSILIEHGIAAINAHTNYDLAPDGINDVLARTLELAGIEVINPEGTDDQAWLDLGVTAFQPSELMKVCFIVTFSAHLKKVKPNTLLLTTGGL